jgi:uncharacterized protein Usg
MELPNSSRDFALMLRDYRLTTAEILYHFPDHPKLLQTYLWQELDIAPKFPILTRFLDFWDRELEGKIHSVRVDHLRLVRAGDWRYGQGEMHIH